MPMMVEKIRKPINVGVVGKTKFALIKRSLLRFGNTLLGTNVLYALQHSVSRLRAYGLHTSPKPSPAAQSLKEKGYSKVNIINLDDIAVLAEKYFSTHPVGKDGVAMLDRQFAEEFTVPLYKALSTKLEQILYDYYGSYFQLYWTNIIRYEKAKVNLGTSFGYHLDDNPNELMKIFFYLNDTYEWNAAFRTFDYVTTKKLLKEGFISSTAEQRIASQKFITPKLEKENLNILEGKKGTVFIFDNNLIHKGTSPKRGFRNVLVVEVYPSHRRFTMDDVYKSLTKPYKGDYPTNPFYNDILI